LDILEVDVGIAGLSFALEALLRLELLTRNSTIAPHRIAAQVRRMLLRDWAERDLKFPARCIAAVAALCVGLALAGCGSGVANLLPGATQPAAGVPSGPTLGYVFSASDGTLRAMMGVRGSARMSASIVPAGVYVAGEASTASSTALLEDGSNTLFAFNLPLSQPIHVADNLPAHAQIVFAPSGRTAIAYVAGGSTITVVSGLPGSPQVQTRNVAAGSPLVSAVVSDSGAIVMVAEGSPMPVGTLSAAGQFSRVTAVSAVGGLSFVPGSDDVLIADSGANTAAVLRSVSSSASVQALTVAGLNQPIAIAGSQDRRWAVIANGGDGGVFRVDLTAGTAVARLTCACQPTLLNSLAGGGTFRVNSLYGGPVWTIDLTNSSPQLLFVPAIAKGTP
jgi:hypothetical protein